MKELQPRQKQILKYLLPMEDFTPVRKIAAILHCSTKTVRNDLMVLEENGINLEKMSGKGIRILPPQKNDVEDVLQEENSLGALSIEHRRMKIIFELLEGTKDKISIQSLSDKYFVSKTSIANDLKVIEDKLAKYNLRLRKDTQGTQLVGSEMDIRKAMVDILNMLISSKTVFQEEPSRIDRETILELEEHFGKYQVDQVKAIIEKAEKLLHFKITEPYYINLVTHILILIHRTKNGKTIYSELKTETGNYDSSFYGVSQKMAHWLEDIFSIQINQEEVFYIYRYLTSSGGIVAQETKKPNEVDQYLEKIARKMIRLSSAICPLQLTFSQSLYNDLLLHLRPMMNRIVYNIEIKNPLLDEIKEEFPDLMLLLKLVVLKIRLQYKLPPISEAEISYIVVYFQSAIEEAISKKRVIIVCSTGVGTSHLLRKRIKNHFPEWNIVKIISAKELEGDLDLESVDLIISTVKLNISLNKPVAYVSALFNKADEKRIRESLASDCRELMPEETEKTVIEDYHQLSKAELAREISQANLINCMAINDSLELCLYKRQGSDKNRQNIRIIKQVRGKNKVKLLVLIRGDEDLSENIIRNLYRMLLENYTGGIPNGFINSY
ncbi:hypothetical protein P22_1393 [Propionispora sp. 2/2-37]|uniref:BglG family transcription antiterminator n=1 Tax=Propionispora sp. 2/2-37 TaxID=1677858 RepID=UPI0006BB8C9E|nr:transcription antiterminator [Propionispora sp. 2/2-37]CUH95323.1 hypothetical protein P22_1393 [Propionispora sp. 2/2-37]